MKKWIAEDWEFELSVTEGKARHCRIGLEEGDKFIFQYSCPADICPRVMPIQEAPADVMQQCQPVKQ